jgi:transposase
MRGRIDTQAKMIAYMDLEKRVSLNHPLRRIKLLADTALAGMDSALTALYKPLGRHSIPPEQLLKASLLQIIYGIRSERQLVERIDDSMIFRWFLDLGLDGDVWVPTVYSHNRDRLLTTDVVRQFLSGVVEQARQLDFVSSEHFSVDGTLIQAWASIKSYEEMPADSKDENCHPPASASQDDSAPKGDAPSQPKGKDVIRDFRGEKFTNATHRSKTDADARLARKSDNTAAKPSYLGNALMENRSGLVVQGEVRLACGDGGETGAALAMIDREEGGHQITLAADKGYDTKEFIASLKEMATTPHVAQNKTAHRGSSVPDAIAQTQEYAVSIRCRKRIEQVFGWVKLAGCLRQVKIRGKAAVDALFVLALSAYNLVRMNNLMAAKA